MCMFVIVMANSALGYHGKKIDMEVKKLIFMMTSKSVPNFELLEI